MAFSLRGKGTGRDEVYFSFKKQRIPDTSVLTRIRLSFFTFASLRYKLVESLYNHSQDQLFLC
jgi:hypothetical protein